MAKYTSLPTQQLPIGSILRAPINETGNTNIKLLAEGTEITRAFLEKLTSRGITKVAISDADMASINAFRPQGTARQPAPSHLYRQSICFNEASKKIDQLVHSGKLSNVNESEHPFMETLEKTSSRSYASGLEKQWAFEIEEQIQQLAELFDSTIDGQSLDVRFLKKQCELLLERICIDQDAFVCFAASPFPSGYPSRHAYHTTCMSLAIGVECGLDREQLIQLGMGCLIHDVGMGFIGLKQFESPTTILATGLRKLADHPIAALSVTDFQEEEFTDAARLVTYQIHERLDGSGYPRGRVSHQIHPFAKIAAVADAFVGMLTPRPHRMGIQGYYAIKKILDETREGKYDPQAVRGLLKATSLFPIGSYVKLTNHQYARVIRANRADYTKPTIVVWGEGQNAEHAVVNLCEQETLAITHSIACPKAA